MVILQTSPFWTSILGILVNSEKVQAYEYCAMAICFCALVAISMSNPETSEALGEVRMTGFVISFVLSWVFSLTSVLNRRLKDVHYAVILFYHAGLGLIAIALYLSVEAFFSGHFRFFSYPLNFYAYAFLSCCFDCTGLLTQTKAFQIENSSFLQLIGYVNVLYGFLFDWLFFGEMISTEELAGAGLIIVVMVSVAVYKLYYK